MGGQGIITTARIIGHAALLEGHRVRGGEVHGLSQRFGSVVSFIRFGSGVHAAMPPKGGAHVILAFEPLEALRNIPYLAPGGSVMVNDRPLPPVQASMGMYAYPDYRRLAQRVEERLGARFYWLNAEALAHRAGDPITVNTVMLGALSRLPGFPLNRESLERAIEENTPTRLHSVNRRAFQLGVEAMEELVEEARAGRRPREAALGGGGRS